MDRLRVVVLGASFGRAVHLPGFAAHPGFVVVGVAGSSEESARRAVAGFDGVAASADWRRLLDEARPDLTVIATPVDLHHPMMMAALERGSHVLCEKPTALDRAQAAAMRDAARRAGRVAAIDHEFRFLPARAEALARVRRGDIGTPRRGEILGRYALWPRPASRGWTWLSDAARGGGVLGALGSHHTDALRLFFGEPRGALASVRVDQPWRGPVDGQPAARRATADDAFTVHYDFADGATALIDVSACVPYRWERFEIHGSEATLRWDESGRRLWRVVAGREPEPLELPDAERFAPREGEHPLLAPFRVMVERLHRALLGVAPMEPDFDDAVAVQSALDAVRAAGARGTRVAVEIPAPA